MSRRVAVVGAGLAAAPHLEALQALGCSVPAVVTGNGDRLAAARRRFPSAAGCRDIGEALAHGVDAALVLTPPNSHLEVVREVAAAGIPMVVEKPLDVSVPRAEEVVRTAADASVGLAVCYQHRAKPAATALRGLLAEGGLGTVLQVAVTVPWWRDPSYYAEPGRGTFERDGGGVLLTQAIHVLDLVLWLVGPPRRVAAVAGRSPAHDAEAETVLSAVFDYGDGRSATLAATVAAYPGEDERVVLVGTRGTARLKGASLETWYASGSLGPAVAGAADAGGVGDPAAIPSAWHESLLADAFAAWDEGRPPLADGQSALVTQRVVAAVYRAAGTGEWVALDDPVLDEDPSGDQRLPRFGK